MANQSVTGAERKKESGNETEATEGVPFVVGVVESHATETQGGGQQPEAQYNVNPEIRR